MEQKIDLKKPNFYSNKNRINRIKKMDKKIILQIQQIIQDIILNTEITNEELEDTVTRDEIKVLVLDILRELIDKKNDYQILGEYEKEIERHLLLSIKVKQPTYQEEEISKLNQIIHNLKQIPQPEQRTPEWYAFRKDRLTASDLGTIIGVNPYEQSDYIVQKNVVSRNHLE